MATVTNSTTLSLTLEVGHDETLSQGDFVVVEGTSLIAQLSHTETAGGAYSAEATFVDSGGKHGVSGTGEPGAVRLTPAE